MFKEVVTGTNIIFYLMMAVGLIGVLAKVMNQVTLYSLVKAAGNMQKSTHKLIKLVRAKYEHALMLHDKVENAEAFVEKYIYEYRGILFRIHTWRQLEIQSIWFAGILAIFGAAGWYMDRGFCEEIYYYIGVGAAEMVLLFVISQLSDEQYKIEATKNYMVDYLENICAQRRRKVRQSERDPINVIRPETGSTGRTKGRDPVVGSKTAVTGSRGTARAFGNETETRRKQETSEIPELSICIEGEPRGVEAEEESIRAETVEERGRIVSISNGYEGGPGILQNETDLSGDGEPEPEAGAEEDLDLKYQDLEEMELDLETGEDLEESMETDTVKPMFHRAGKERADPEEKEESVMKEEVIRQILEEFLA